MTKVLGRVQELERVWEPLDYTSSPLCPSPFIDQITIDKGAKRICFKKKKHRFVNIIGIEDVRINSKHM